MAIAMLLEVPGGTQEQYEGLNQKAFGDPKGPAETPAGLIIHTAGPTSSGWRIFDVWETEDEFQRFQSEHIMPAAQAMGMPPIPPEVYEITNIVGAGAPARMT